MPKKGYKQTPEARAKTSASLIGNHRAKGNKSKGFTGTHSQATREKMRASRLAYVERIRAERRRRGGLAHLGTHQAPDHIEKRMTATDKTLRKKHGPRWRRVLGKRAGAVTGAKPRTGAQLAALAKARAARSTPRATGEALALIRRTRELQAMTALDLLIVEDLAAKPDAKAYVRSVIEGLKGHPVIYTLADARAAGYSASAIQAALGISKSQAYEVLARLHRADSQLRSQT